MESQKVRPGHKIEIDGLPYVVMSYQHVQAPRTGGKNVLKLKGLTTGAIIERTFNSGENIKEADIEMKRAQFLYANGEEYSFMDQETFDQFEFDEEKLGDSVEYLTEGLEVYVMKWNGNPINIDLPPTVNLKVVETEPGLRGDTASGGSKPAKLETGLVVQVPFFINADDVLVVNTQTGEYRERAK